MLLVTYEKEQPDPKTYICWKLNSPLCPVLAGIILQKRQGNYAIGSLIYRPFCAYSYVLGARFFSLSNIYFLFFCGTDSTLSIPLYLRKIKPEPEDYHHFSSDKDAGQIKGNTRNGGKEWNSTDTVDCIVIYMHKAVIKKER